MTTKTESLVEYFEQEALNKASQIRNQQITEVVKRLTDILGETPVWQLDPSRSSSILWEGFIISSFYKAYLPNIHHYTPAVPYTCIEKYDSDKAILIQRVSGKYYGTSFIAYDKFTLGGAIKEINAQHNAWKEREKTKKKDPDYNFSSGNYSESAWTRFWKSALK